MENMKNQEQLDELTMAFEDRWNVCNRRHHGHPHAHHSQKPCDFLCSASAKAARRQKRDTDRVRDRSRQ